MENVRQFLRGLKLDSRTATLLTGAACGVGALVVLVRKVSIQQVAKEKIQRARNRRAESVQRAEEAVLRYKEAHPMTDSALILTLSLAELTKQLKEGSLSPEEVLYSYMEKAVDVHKKLNCCTGILLDSFDQLKTVKNNEGLLYGVPVSIKENIACKNHDCSRGLAIDLDKPALEDSVLVEVLRRQGAIPFVKTNLPQALLNYDCSNPVYGQTVNPHNLQKTSGGSSGGEGALIAGGGSLLGIGTDIGGSIRIPAAFCGICGFKPTAGRISLQGMKQLYRGQKSVQSSPGPLARDVDSLALCMQALLCDHMFSLDPTVPPLPFNAQIYRSSKPLRIGYVLNDDGYTQFSPSMNRCIREVKALLEQAGHTLVPYHPLRVNQITPELLLKGIFADGCTSMLRELEGSSIDPCLIAQVVPYYFPKWLKRIMSFLLKPLSCRGSENMRALCGVGSVSDMWKHHGAVEDYIRETIAEWRRCDIDVLLCPAFGPAYNFFYCSKATNVVSLTMLYNLLNFPAGAVPVSTVTAEDEEELKHYKGLFQDQWDKYFKEAVSGGEGLPMAVQCVALPWQDELCLRFMKEVEQLVKQSRK